jgi:hypothetical protein
MKNGLLSIFFSFLFINSFGQSADFIILKKHHRTMAVYFKGLEISLITKRGAYIRAQIRDIKNDTVYLREYITQKLMSRYGTIFLDTLGSYSYQYHYKDIAGIGTDKNRKFDLSSSGVNLMGGSVLLTAGCGVTWIADHKKFNPALLGGSLALGALGYALFKHSSKPIMTGRKYTFVYMNTVKTIQ